MITTHNVSRRDFLNGMFSAGAFVAVARMVPESMFAQAPGQTKAESAALHPSVYLGIEPDGTVYIVTHRSEMGTGIRTSLPIVAADELDADWTRVKIEQGTGDAKYGDQNTDGSKSIRDFFDAFRQAGASARFMLVSAAATQWGVPTADCVTASHEVTHPPTGRRLGYGALVPAAAKLPVPKTSELQLKPRSRWKYIGKEHPIYDLSNIVTGKAIFGMDAKRDGMVYASIEHPPVVGGTLSTLDDKEALQVRGVANIYHVFAASSFADELAHAAGRDPLEYLLDLLGPGSVVDLKAQGVENYWNYGVKVDAYPLDTRRLRRVIEIAGEESGWSKRKPGNGWGVGIAAARSFTSYVASVVEVEVDRQGTIRIPRVHQIVDAGTVINPDRVRAQFEGAAVMGACLAMSGEITAAGGRIVQSNFDTYQVGRMNTAPSQTDVHIVESDALPGGVGEPGLPPIVPALANAIYAATGKRIRELPISKHKLV